MIYAINRKTKEHRVIDSGAGGLHLGSYPCAEGETLIETRPEGWIPWDGRARPLPDDHWCDVLIFGKRVVPNVVCHAEQDWEGVTHYRPAFKKDAHPEPFKVVEHGSALWREYKEPEALEWDGDGVPAAGLQVDCKDAKMPKWTRCQVVFSSDYVVVVEAVEGNGKGAQVALDVLGQDGLGRLRPIRTPAQRAEDEAVASIRDVVKGEVGTDRSIYEAIYRAIRDGKVPGVNCSP